jgi:RNA exonuclease 4
MNMNVPFYVWPHQQPVYYDYNPNAYYCEELSMSSGDGYNRRFGNHPTYQNLPLHVEVETLSHEQQNQYVALDCEMVGVGSEGIQSALARVTIIDWHGNVLMDEYVKQQQKVTDYRTFVSGMTKDILDRAKMDFAACRRRVQDILKGKTLVGHALKNDLGVLGIRHPWHMTRDTATYEPFMKVRFTDGVLWPRGLKDLCKEKLDRDIQAYGKPHCPREDALAALDLYRTVWQDWEKNMAFKISQTSAIHRVNSHPKSYSMVAMPK